MIQYVTKRKTRVYGHLEGSPPFRRSCALERRCRRSGEHGCMDAGRPGPAMDLLDGKTQGKGKTMHGFFGSYYYYFTLMKRM